MVFQACLPFGSRNRYEVLSCNQASLLQKPLDPSSSAILTHRGSMQGSAHPECLRSVQNRRPMDLLTDFSGIELNKRYHPNPAIHHGPCERLTYWARSPHDYVTRTRKWTTAQIVNPAPKKRFGLVAMIDPRQAIGGFPPLMKDVRDICEAMPRKVHS